MAKAVSKLKLSGVLAGLALSSSLAGCGGGGGSSLGAGLPAGETCQSVRARLNQLDAKGVPALIESQSNGRKLSGQQKADADAYNNLLNQYLGARCHEAPKPPA